MRGRFRGAPSSGEGDVSAEFRKRVRAALEAVARDMEEKQRHEYFEAIDRMEMRRLRQRLERRVRSLPTTEGQRE